jgi:four helix bundle suffix protein
MNDQKLIRPPGDYNKLYCYQKAEAIFDATYYFVHTFLERGDRTIGQMQQAARSGKQNISEGYTRAGTSVDSAITLIDVAKSSLIELHGDYCDYLRTRGFRIWEENSKEWLAMRDLGCKHNDSPFYMKLVKTRPPETIANMMICLQKQTDYLLAKLLEKLEKEFLKEGGFKERMTRMRVEERKKKGKD